MSTDGVNMNSYEYHLLYFSFVYLFIIGVRECVHIVVPF